MSPVRRDRDFQRTEINDWDEWVEEQIQKQEASGAFDNLPDAGKPIHIHHTELNPQYDLAFSRLKNAGIMPAWMELDREVAALGHDLDDFLERSAVWIEQQCDEIVQSRSKPDNLITPGPPARPWWDLWHRVLDYVRLDADLVEHPAGPQTLGELLVIRSHIRAQYLERAAVLDVKIRAYHNSLPEALGHLQRLRMLPDRAGRRFDTRLPEAPLLAGGLNEE